jgi:hypothetical protein
VAEWGAGVVAEPDDEAAIKAAFDDLWRRWEDGDLADQSAVRARVLDAYSRRAGGERLARVLDEACRG